MVERTRTTEEIETSDTDRYLVDETPDLRPSRQRERDHTPDNYTTGYDPYGYTRIGIGSGGGDTMKLIRYNEGRHPSDGNHSAREAARDKKRITQSFCSVLDVTSYQQRESAAVMSRLNLDRFGYQKRLEKVALGVIKVIVDWDRFRPLQQTVDLANIDEERLPDRMIESDRYCELLDEYDVSGRDLRSVSRLIKRELKKHNYFGSGSRDARGADIDDERAVTSDS